MPRKTFNQNDLIKLRFVSLCALVFLCVPPVWNLEIMKYVQCRHPAAKYSVHTNIFVGGKKCGEYSEGCKLLQLLACCIPHSALYKLLFWAFFNIPRSTQEAQCFWEANLSHTSYEGVDITHIYNEIWKNQDKYTFWWVVVWNRI